MEAQKIFFYYAISSPSVVLAATLLGSPQSKFFIAVSNRGPIELSVRQVSLPFSDRFASLLAGGLLEVHIW